MNPIEAISQSKDKFMAQIGTSPAIVFIHPDKADLFAEITEINGIRIIIPTWNELQKIAFMCGTDAKADDFWNPDNAFLMDQEAFDRITKPIALGIAPIDYP